MSDSALVSADPVPAKPHLLSRVAGLFRGGLRELSVPTEQRIPFLDALRTIAVLLVINGHTSEDFARKFGPNPYTGFVLSRGGWMGVDLFFVLSGFFIGGQLWKELGRTGTVSMRNFMIRRGLRIWPLYFFIFAVVTMTMPGYAAAMQHGWSDLLFITNYVPHGIVQGSWSLATEEQFYIITPLALLLIGRRSPRAYRWGLGALLAAVLLVRALTFVALTGQFWHKNPAAFDQLYYPFHTHCDGLIAGLFVANLVTSKERFGGLLARPGLLVLLSFLLLGGLSALQGDIFEFTGLAIFFASVVWWGVSTQTKACGQYIFYLISRLSFGMYLCHEYMGPVIVRHVEPAFARMHLGAVAATGVSFLLLAAAAMAIAAITFCLVEHPFLILRSAILRKVQPHLTAH